MGSSITFSATRPLRGWGLDVFDTWERGQLARVTVKLEARLSDGERRSGLFAFLPETPGFDVMVEAVNGYGVERLHDAAVYLVDATREALDNRTDLTSEQRGYWLPVVEAADEARVWHAARYAAGVPAFEVVGALSVAVPA